MIARHGGLVRGALGLLIAVALLAIGPHAHAAPGDAGGIADSAIALGDAGVVTDSGLVVTPQPIDFGLVPIHTQPTRTAALKNTEQLLSIDVTAFTKPATSDCGPFAVAPDQPLPETIAPITGRTWTITFKPVVAGSYDCTVAITDTDGDIDVIHLLGQGGAPQLSVTPQSVLFGNVATGSSVDQIVSLANTGSTPLTIDNVGLMPASPPFALVGAPLAFPLVLQPGDATSATVRFSPTAAITSSAALVIDSDDPTTPMRTVGVSGTGVAPGGGVLTMSPSPVTFGTVAVGMSAPATLTLGNSGTASLDVTGMTITGPNDFTFDDAADGCVGGQACAAAFAIGAAATHPVPVRCAPTAGGTRLASLTVATTASGTRTVTLTCDGTAAGITVSPPSMQFGTIRVNTTTSQSLSIGNDGNSELHVAAIAIEGATPGDFAIAGCAAGCTIPASVSQVVSVSFTPTARGARSASLHITSDDPAQPDLFVALAGTGGAGVLVVTTPTSGDLDFGQIPVGTTSSPADVTIQNQGEVSLAIASADPAPSIFARAGQAPPLALAPGATATWPITCHPTSTATVDGALTITSDALTSAVQSVTLHCTGTDSALVASPSPLAFGAVRTDRTATRQVTLTNTGAVAVTIDHLATSAAVYVASATGLPRTLTQNQTLTVDVVFAPTAEQAYPATLTFRDAAQTALATVALSGDGHVPAFTVAPTAIDFGATCAGQAEARDVTITNTGTATIRVTATTIAGAGFAIASGDVGGGLDLAPTQSRTLTLTAQAASGTRTGTLTLATDLATGGSATIPLTIAGASGPVVEPVALSFGDQPVGASSAPRDLRVRNCGVAPLVITAAAITGDPRHAFVLGGPGDGTIAVGAEAAWTVVFAPPATGAFAATVAITTDADAISVPLDGTGVGGPDAGTGPSVDGDPRDTTSYYACACRAPADPAAAAPLVLAVALVLRRRRR